MLARRWRYVLHRAWLDSQGCGGLADALPAPKQPFVDIFKGTQLTPLWLRLMEIRNIVEVYCPTRACVLCSG